MEIAAYCDFATMYRMSPVAHKIPERSVTDEQHAFLQKLEWDAVSNYPCAEIALVAK